MSTTMSVADARYLLNLRDHPDMGKFRPAEASCGHLLRRRQVIRLDGRWVPSPEAVAMAERVLGKSTT